MKDLKNIEDLFKESFNEFEITPPDSVKASVDKAIQSRKKGMWWLPVLALLLATAPFAYYWMSEKNTNDNEKASQKELSFISPSSIDSNSTIETYSDSKSNVNKTKLDAASKTSKSKTKLTNKNTEGKSIGKVSTQPNNKSLTVKEKKQTNASKEKNIRKTTVKTPRNSTKKHPLKKTTKNKKYKGQNLKYPVVEPNLTLDPVDDEHNPISDQSVNAEPEKVVPSSSSIKDSAELAKAAVKKDSISTQKTDSTSLVSNDSVANSNQKSTKDKSTENNWLVSTYFGPQFDKMNVLDKDSTAIKMNTGFRFSAEINRNLFSGFGVSTGFGYFNSGEDYTRYSYQFDSTFLYIDSLPILDQNDSVIGYNYFNVYDIDTTQNSSQSSYKLSSIAIPLYLTKQFELTDKWGVFVQAGMVYRITKITGDPSNPLPDLPTINKNSVMISGRVHASYKWNNWMFSLGMNTGFYVKPPLEYPGVKTSRSYFTPEFGVHFSF